MVTGVQMGTTGRRISGARKARGLTQQALADKMGVGRSTVANWEIDKVIPEAPSLLTLSTILGVNARWLLMQEENPTPYAAVTPDESALLNAFRNLSETGKEALRAYLGYLTSQDFTQPPTASQPFPKARTKSK